MIITILGTHYLSNICQNIKKMLIAFFNFNNIYIYYNIHDLKNVNTDIFFLIGAQFFNIQKLLSYIQNKKYIIYQLEQLDKIKLDKSLVQQSFYILDYTDLHRYQFYKYSILYPPFSNYNINNIIKKHKDFDILFYGCINNRRRQILNKLKNNYNYKIKIFNNLKGDDLYNNIQKARIVLNINFYKPAVFEISRINEILPYNTTIISELDLIDDDTKKLYSSQIYFIPNIDIHFQQLINTINFILINKKYNHIHYQDIINNINIHNKNILTNILFNN